MQRLSNDELGKTVDDTRHEVVLVFNAIVKFCEQSRPSCLPFLQAWGRELPNRYPFVRPRLFEITHLLHDIPSLKKFIIPWTTAVETFTAAANELASNNFALVNHTVFGQLRDGEVDDMKQVGYLSLISAAERFDHSKGYRFSTFALSYIRQALTRWNRADKLIPLPEHERLFTYQVFTATQMLSKQFNRQPTSLEVATKIGRDVEWVEEHQSYYKRHVISFSEAPFKSVEETSTMSWHDVLYDPDAESPEDEASHTQIKDRLWHALSKILRKRELEVIALRYGLDSDNPDGLSLEEVGKHFGITRERARQIEKVIFRKLRDADNRKYLQSYVGVQEVCAVLPFKYFPS